MTGSRDIDSATASAASSATIHPVLLVKLELDGGDVLVHSELGDLAFDGDTYTGIGILGGIDAAEEVSDLSRTPIRLTLSGIPSTLLSIVLGQQYQGRTATVYLGYLDPTTRQLVADPAILYRGLIDTADIRREKDFTITLGVESRFALWDKPINRRHNDADQQGRYPGDRGMQFLERTVGKAVIWGGR